jgi:hypothetical protein
LLRERAWEAKAQTSSPERTELLKPPTHLTDPCWRDFKRFVASHAGWSAKRREATEEEKRAHGDEKRKGKAYFVDVVFNPEKPKPAMRRPGCEASTANQTQSVNHEAAMAQFTASISSWLAATGGANGGGVSASKRYAEMLAPTSAKMPRLERMGVSDDSPAQDDHMLS